MEGCADCGPPCLLCPESPHPACLYCQNLQASHRTHTTWIHTRDFVESDVGLLQDAHMPTAGAFGYNLDPNVSSHVMGLSATDLVDELQSTQDAATWACDASPLDTMTSNMFSFSTSLEPTPLFPTKNETIPDHNLYPPARRREWSLKENLAFQSWITDNPKPTKQQKHDFANSHTLLTPSQVQNKINNWRNSQRNPKRPSAMPSIYQDVSSRNHDMDDASAIMRYLNSSESEADLEDIESAARTASLQDHRAEADCSDLMRLPSLKHNLTATCLGEKLVAADGWDVAAILVTQPGNTNWDDFGRPQSPAKKHNPLPPRPEEEFFDDGWEFTGPIELQPTRTSQAEFGGNFTSRANSVSRAKSIASSGTNHSGSSVQSIRYGAKLKRRSRAHQRLHSRRADTSKRAGDKSPKVSSNFEKAYRKPEKELRARWSFEQYGASSEMQRSLSGTRVMSEVTVYPWGIWPCTFCHTESFSREEWRAHERTHCKIPEGRSADHMLWECGICYTAGMSEDLRCEHAASHRLGIIPGRHWSGEPRIRYLAPTEAKSISKLSYEMFQVYAKGRFAGDDSVKEEVVPVKKGFFAAMRDILPWRKKK